jgi:hypothetical protein
VIDNAVVSFEADHKRREKLSGTKRYRSRDAHGRSHKR